MPRIFVLTFGLTLVATATLARPATCYMSIGSEVVIDGRCEFDAFGGDGSFQITTPDGRWFAVVSIFRPGAAQGWWNGAPFGGRAQTPLGELTRSDACWVNETVSVCAW